MSQPEGDFSRKVMAALRRRGAWVYKVWGNEKTPAGIPDIIGTYRSCFIGVESKMPGNDLSEIQKYRIGKIRQAGGFVAAPCYSVDFALEMLILIDELVENGGESAKAKQMLASRYGNGHSLPIMNWVTE